MNDTDLDGPDFDSDEFDEYAERILRGHVARLMEHFDTVQIVVTKHVADDVGTASHWAGSGNLYARAGSLRTCLRAMDKS